MSNPFEFRPAGDAEAFRNAHKSSDTDAESLSMHHTLGRGSTQAAPGNHDHDGDYSSIVHDHDADYSPLDTAIFVGVVLEFPLGAIGAKYLEFNGQSVLRADYPELFALWGTTYGAVDGTHFNVGPVTADKFPIGNSGTKAVGATGGSATTALPNHVHSDTHTHGPGTLGTDTHTPVAANTVQGSGTTVLRTTAAATTHNHAVTTGVTADRSAANTGNPTTNPNIAIDPPWYATRKIVRALP